MPNATHNEADIAAVLATVRLYYEGMMEGDEAKLRRAFHPRASIVGNEPGAVYWTSVDTFLAECRSVAGQTAPAEWRIESLAITGDTALVHLGNRFAGVWYSDDLSMLRIEGDWRIVHKTFYAHPTS